MIREHRHVNILIAYSATHMHAHTHTPRFGNRFASLLVMRM
jgi:hypothetical protein